MTDPAVLAVKRDIAAADAIARRHGICEATLYRLRDEFLAAGKEALAEGRGGEKKTAERVTKLEKAIAHRDRVIGELTIANRILKKVEEGLL